MEKEIEKHKIISEDRERKEEHEKEMEVLRHNNIMKEIELMGLHNVKQYRRG